MMDFDLSQHRRMALLQRFAPAEIIEDSIRPTRAKNVQAEGRFHFWGVLEGRPVDICITWGGVFRRPSIRTCSMEPALEASIFPDTIAAAVRDSLRLEE